MIIIHYSQFFDEGVFLEDQAEKRPQFNVLYHGPAGLLGFFEQILGLTGNYSDENERITRYAIALRKHLDADPDAFYAKAFSNDEVGVSKDLIKWRDELILSGWNGDISGDQPPRLKSLLAVEKHFAEKYYHFGIADRWQNVLASMLKNKITDEFRIYIYDDEDLIHPFYQKLFGILNDRVEFKNLTDNIIITDNNLGRIKKILYSQPDEKLIANPLQDDDSFAILKIKDNHHSADILAHLIKKGYYPVVISSDTKILDHYLVASGLPASGSELLASNPLIIQLFKLVAVCLTTPLNVYNLLSFLQSPYLPIPKKLASRLAALLIDMPGVNNPKWLETIDNYFKEAEMEDGADINKIRNRQKDSMIFLNFNINEPVDVKQASEVYSALKVWAEKHAVVDTFNHSEEERDQFAYLSKLSEVFLDKLRSFNGVLESSRFHQLVESIYEPASFTNYECQANSVRHVASPSRLLGNPEIVWWHDCYNALLNTDRTSFLYMSEKDFLKETGIHVYPSEKQVRLAYYREKYAILKANRQCILVYVERHNGEEITAHPLISEIKSRLDKPENIMATIDDLELLVKIKPQPDLSVMSSLPKKKAYVQIEKPENFKRREVESASSIEKLIQHPFEWVVNYQARLKLNDSFTLPEIFTLKGSVAHAVTQEILTEFGQEGLESLAENLIIEKINKKIMEEGLIFFLYENKFEYEDLIRKYLFAFRSLVEIINENELIIIGSEVLKENNIDRIGMVQGTMDLLLKAKDGEEFILDLKWTRKNTKYQTKIEKGKDIQLAIYYAINETKPKTAYFMFDTGKLISRHSFKGNNVIKTDGQNLKSEEEVFQMTVNSFEYRWEELLSGKVEIGDDCRIEELDYSNDLAEKNLILPDMDEMKKIKYGDQYSGLELFKGIIQ